MKKSPVTLAVLAALVGFGGISWAADSQNPQKITVCVDWGSKNLMYSKYWEKCPPKTQPITFDLEAEDGKSAFELAQEAGYSGNLSTWLSSLRGPAGATGPQGPQGPQGPTGATGTAGAVGPAGAADSTAAIKFVSPITFLERCTLIDGSCGYRIRPDTVAATMSATANQSYLAHIRMTGAFVDADGSAVSNGDAICEFVRNGEFGREPASEPFGVYDSFPLYFTSAQIIRETGIVRSGNDGMFFVNCLVDPASNDAGNRFRSQVQVILTEVDSITADPAE